MNDNDIERLRSLVHTFENPPHKFGTFDHTSNTYLLVTESGDTVTFDRSLAIELTRPPAPPVEAVEEPQEPAQEPTEAPEAEAPAPEDVQPSPEVQG